MVYKRLYIPIKNSPPEKLIESNEIIKYLCGEFIKYANEISPINTDGCNLIVQFFKSKNGINGVCVLYSDMELLSDFSRKQKSKLIIRYSKFIDSIIDGSIEMTESTQSSAIPNHAARHHTVTTDPYMEEKFRRILYVLQGKKH